MIVKFKGGLYYFPPPSVYLQVLHVNVELTLFKID